MAQTNFTPILLYGSSTPTNVPLAANLTNNSAGSEIAINVADKNLFFKDSGGVVNTVPIRQSSASSNGWLSSTDWSTFNSKAPATSGTSLLYGNGAGGFSNVTIGSGISFAGGTLSATGTGGTVTSVAALTLGTTGTDLSSTVANGTTTPVITLNVPTASAANRGALSAADWSTFNGKQAALVSGTNIKTVGGVTLLGSGDAGTIGVGYGGTGLTAVTAGYIPFGSTSTALATSANLTYINGWLQPQGNTSGVAPSGNAGLAFGWNYSAGGAEANIMYGTFSGSGYLAFSTFNAGTVSEKARIFASGGVSIGNTTDPGAGVLFVSSGVRFPATQVASADANTLDDYEEGTWTPTGNGVTFTTGTTGWYTKVGNLVTLNFIVNWPVTANGSPAYITNLPFTTNTNAGVALGGYSSDINMITLVGNTILYPTNLLGTVVTVNATLSGKTVVGCVSYMT
jgi:hypothetical protein